MNLYQTWNNPLRNILWWFVIIGMLCSLPLAYTRHQTETSTNQVEFVFDYRDLLDICRRADESTELCEDRAEEHEGRGH